MSKDNWWKKYHEKACEAEVKVVKQTETFVHFKCKGCGSEYWHYFLDCSKKIAVFEEISREEAKKRIFKCLNEIDEKIYPSEIAERLHINYELCVEVIEELLKEGKIEIVGE